MIPSGNLLLVPATHVNAVESSHSYAAYGAIKKTNSNSADYFFIIPRVFELDVPNPNMILASSAHFGPEEASDSGIDP